MGHETIIRTVDVWIEGIPVTKGSVRAIPIKRGEKMGAAVIYDNNKTLRTWENHVSTTVSEIWQGVGRRVVHDDTVAVTLEFWFDRPKSHYLKRSKLPFEQWPLDPKAPKRPIAKNKNDIDKLARAVLDALTGVIYADDSQVCSLYCDKLYTNRQRPAGLKLKITA